MIEKELFKAKFLFEPTAATIGINSDDWYCYKPGMTKAEVCDVMRIKKYDIVPILNKHFEVTGYFTLDVNKNANPNGHKLKEEDSIYYLTHIRDVIWRMLHNKRDHYFLSNKRESNDIIGLISLSNFNCREFNLYLFSLLSYIEKELANLIELGEEIAMEYLDKYSTTDEAKGQLEGIKKRIKGDRDKKVENDYKSYLYIPHLIHLIEVECKYVKLGYKNAEDFRKGTKVLKDLRNNIAHPVRSIVRNFKDLKEVEIGMNKMYELKSKLETYNIN